MQFIGDQELTLEMIPIPDEESFNSPDHTTCSDVGQEGTKISRQIRVT